MDEQLDERRLKAAGAVIYALASQPGVDVLPAAIGRFLGAVYKLTGYKFRQIGHGRHRDVFDIIGPDSDLGIVLKVGNKPSTDREIEMTMAFPEDWAKVYATFDHGVVSERVSMLAPIDDPRSKTEEFKKRATELDARYIGVTHGDVGYIGDRIVLVGSSKRVQVTVGGQKTTV